jgi:cell fate (sporulation/competence/biofilm development) regulator YlbF (YheA/YmcA/DUF963 family)
MVIEKYDAEFHHKQFTNWTLKEEKYLIENYRKVKITELSDRLERTYRAVQKRIEKLKLSGEITQKRK